MQKIYKFLLKIIEKKIKNLWYYLIKYVSILIISKIMDNCLILYVSNDHINHLEFVTVTFMGIWIMYMYYKSNLLKQAKIENHKKQEELLSGSKLENEQELLNEIKITDLAIQNQQEKFDWECSIQAIMLITLYKMINIMKNMTRGGDE